MIILFNQSTIFLRKCKMKFQNKLRLSIRMLATLSTDISRHCIEIIHSERENEWRCTHVIVVERAVLGRFASHNDFPNAAGDLRLEVQGVLECLETAKPFLAYGLQRELEQFAHVAGQLTTHQQVLDYLDRVLTLLAGALQE